MIKTAKTRRSRVAAAPSPPRGEGGRIVTFGPKLRSGRLADQLYEAIVKQIVSGKLPTGGRMPSENQLCDAFKVSRPVVREAMARLQADGLVVTRQGAGTMILKRPRDDFLALAPTGGIADLMRCFEYRIAVEGEAAFLAAQRRTPEAMAEIDAAMAELEGVIARAEVGVEADRSFHNAIARASQNALFEQTLTQLAAHIFALMYVARNLSLRHSRERLTLVEDEHRRIVEAIRAGDGEQARMLMRRHIDNARSRVLGDNAEP